MTRWPQNMESPVLLQERAKDTQAPKVASTHINTGRQTPEQMLGHLVTGDSTGTGDRDGPYLCQAHCGARTGRSPV